MTPRPFRRRLPRHTLPHVLRAGAALVTCLAVVSGCGGDDAPAPVEGVIDRETFIATYVDLRTAAARDEDVIISDEERDRILASHGVDAESLLRFAEVYGTDLDFMNAVWAEVESRMDEELGEPPASR